METENCVYHETKHNSQSVLHDFGIGIHDRVRNIFLLLIRREVSEATAKDLIEIEFQFEKIVKNLKLLFTIIDNCFIFFEREFKKTLLKRMADDFCDWKQILGTLCDVFDVICSHSQVLGLKSEEFKMMKTSIKDHTSMLETNFSDSEKPLFFERTIESVNEDEDGEEQFFFTQSGYEEVVVPLKHTVFTFINFFSGVFDIINGKEISKVKYHDNDLFCCGKKKLVKQIDLVLEEFKELDDYEEIHFDKEALLEIGKKLEKWETIAEVLINILMSFVQEIRDQPEAMKFSFNGVTLVQTFTYYKNFLKGFGEEEWCFSYDSQIFFYRIDEDEFVFTKFGFAGFNSFIDCAIESLEFVRNFLSDKKEKE